MTLFLFAKQIVDMLYQYRALDYMMVIWVCFLLVYQVVLVRPDFRKKVTMADGVVILLGLLLTFSFIRSGSGYEIYFKVMSAFLIYFVGRVYYDRIKECYGALVTAAYIVVYLNFFVRIKNFGFAFLQVKDAGGDLYYYDTDMAFAMILAMVFIAMLGKNSIGKILTIFVVCPYMVFCSDAGIQSMLMIAVYGIMALYVLELIFRKKKLFNLALTLMILGIIGVVVIVYLPVLGFDDAQSLVGLFSNKFLNQANMHSRYTDWNEILESVAQSSMFEKLFGINMGAEITIESLYIKIFYALGYAGIILTVVLILNIMYYVVKVEDRKTFYLAVIMTVILLGSGVTVSSMEATQMSWFPLLFAGMVVSSVQEEDRGIVAVITGTVRPKADMNYLALSDEQARLKQYKEALLYVIESGAFKRIIFCENSNYGTENFLDLQKEAENRQIQLELFSFVGNKQAIAECGKGYGEGEIMEYVMKHSRLLCPQDSLLKMTGRLKVMNIRRITEKLNKEKCYFNIPNPTRRDMYDTRIYAMPVTLFQRCFLQVYKQVQDDEGVFLENVYTTLLKENKIKVTNFPRYPRIMGVSGSTGEVYTYTEWKCKVKDIISLLGGYQVK